MSQGYSILKATDPYHLVTGAVNCDDVWMFNEVAAVGLPQSNKSEQGVVTIPFGRQPRKQLALDCPMIENYGGEPFSQYSNMADAAIS